MLRRTSHPEQLETFRQVLVGPEQRRLDGIESSLTATFGQVLPEAVAEAGRSRPSALATALEQPVSRALHDLARHEPDVIGTLVAPMVGTAVRRAISEAIAALLQHLNQLLERGLSIHSLRWRFEAKRTGRSYGEVVLAHTLVYRVEWALLIDSDTGLLLEKSWRLDAPPQEPDQMSAMLQAIGAFATDALQPTAPGAALHTIEVGDLQVWIERDTAFTLALAIRGAAPPELRGRMRSTLDAVRTLHGSPERDGKTSSYADTRLLLGECLAIESKPIPRRANWIFAALGIAIAAGIVLMSLHRAAERRADVRLRSAYQRALSQEPGFVVTQLEHTERGYRIAGLRDPRARAPESVVAQAGLPPATFDMFPYESPDIRLAPPPAVVDALVAELEQISIPFGVEQSDVAGNSAALRRAAELIMRAQRAAVAAGVVLCIEVHGETDRTGPDALNATLRAERARSVGAALGAAGVAREALDLHAGDSMQPPPSERRATFRALIRPGAAHGGCP